MTPTLSKAHFSCVYSANLLMKESSFSGMITLLVGWGQQMLGLWPLLPPLKPLLLPAPRPPSCPQASLEGLHRPRIKVAFGVHRGPFLSLG